MHDESDNVPRRTGISKGDFGDTRVSEQRAEKRCSVSLKVSYKTYDEFIDEYTKNVSRQGMFIRTTRSHMVHELIDLFLHVPGLDDPVRIIGETVHVTADNAKDEDAGVGVKFVDIDDKSRQILIAFIQSRETRL